MTPYQRFIVLSGERGFIMQSDIVTWSAQLYVSIAEYAVPIALVFGISNLIVNTFLGVAFGGKLKIGGVK